MSALAAPAQPNATAAICPITELGVLHCSGDDALQFLQSQLSNDFALLGHDSARLAAYLSAKGRMQASFIGVRLGPTDVLLLVHRSVLAAVQKRLSMFILRAKVRLSDASAQWQLHGLLGQAAIEQAISATLAADAGDAAGHTPEPAPLAPWQAVANAAARSGAAADAAPAWVIGLYPAAGQPRALHIAPSGSAASLPATRAQQQACAAWAYSEVLAGVATISAPVVELFVPQMLNYESVGGVSFKKGCYPGQEVVARSQFRGAIKRRAFLANGQAAELPEPGTEIFSASDPDQPCGVVVQSAWHSQTEASGSGPRPFAAIVSLKTDCASQPLQLAAPGSSATPLQIQPAPYPILDDV
ncbi:YgfZ/GcvT domain-containing protein [Vandammella animalimorsus]|uniref:Folate-binding protein YgfZ n=1 Tax=Vandammella animalimorsus TaxID=2029117 RepID=A0A2A2AFQ0_9BURK|nr:folate-binding protein YgfZ [Vandammella animalimorsus]PAT36636.1 folate-binding protein YgfZ [Vandammella animalimorsus]